MSIRYTVLLRTCHLDMDLSEKNEEGFCLSLLTIVSAVVDLHYLLDCI